MSTASSRVRDALGGATQRRLLGAALAVGVLLLPFVLDITWLTVGVYAGIYGIAAVGTALLLNTAGVVSLGQAGFFAVGAYTAAILTTQHGVGWVVASVAATVVAAVAGLGIGSLFYRLRGHYISLATLAFSVIVLVVANEAEFTGGSSGIIGVPKPSIGERVLFAPADYFQLIWVVAIVAAYVAARMVRARPSRGLRAARDAEVAALSSGVPVRRLRLQAFVVSAAFAGLGGSFYGYWLGIVSPESAAVLLGVDLLIMAVIGGAGPWSALAGAVLVGVLVQSMVQFVPIVIPGASGEFQLVGLGILLTVAAIGFSGGLAGLGRRVLPPARRPAPAGERPEPHAVLAPQTGDDGTDPGATLLEAEHLGRSFGGVRAVDDVSVTVRAGELVGLIGPNGAGKSTTFNLVTGAVTRDTGTVRIRGRELPPGQIGTVARAGAARTFQNLALFSSMSAVENVMVACDALGRVGMLGGLVGRQRAEEVRLRDRAVQLLALLDLEEQADTLVTDLSFGQQRRVEIARALAARPRLLLLDEPMAGLAPHEREELAGVLAVLRDVGVGVLLVEHDVEAVLRICDRVVVLDQGRMLAEGPPARIRADERVIEAYLGLPHDTPDASGAHEDEVLQ